MTVYIILNTLVDSEKNNLVTTVAHGVYLDFDTAEKSLQQMLLNFWERDAIKKARQNNGYYRFELYDGSISEFKIFLDEMRELYMDKGGNITYHSLEDGKTK